MLTQAQKDKMNRDAWFETLKTFVTALVALAGSCVVLHFVIKFW